MQLKSRSSQWFALSLATTLALATLALAWPRLQASYRFLPVDLAIERYFEDRQIPSQRLLTLLGFAGQAARTHDHYRYHDGLSFLHYLRGLDIYTPALQRRDAFRAAETEAIEAVRRAPAQPEAWLRLATVRSILRDEPETVLAPWRMSVFTGRTHSTLLAHRVGVALPYLEYMDEESRAMLRDQLLLAWSLKRAELLRELKLRDPALQRTRELLQGFAPEALAELEAGIEKAR
ncbi:MAG: hypothetical protein EHM68_09845 [Lysobacterales bacterium]|nr:MAG: hypothetical protein EHM68_09845 [Xanthomonadales bacterium]